MLPYQSLQEAEQALGRHLTYAETLWFNYSANMSDYFLYCHTILFLFLVFTLVPLPVVFMELKRPKIVEKYKIQPKVRIPRSLMFKCYRDVMRMFFLVVGPLQLLSYPSVKWVGIRTSLPLPSGWEMFLQLAVYFIYTAPIGFAAPYAHWAEILILGIPSFLGPAIVPCHMITFWLWIVLRQVEAIETHSGYDFPWIPTKYIPFYGGAEYHDYHHFVGGQSQSNFASVFTYCDYIYGTDKGYRFQKQHLAKVDLQSPLLFVFSVVAMVCLTTLKEKCNDDENGYYTNEAYKSE
ncbi:hypothetical protein Sjap_020831 [Stephania japonica]|uniref:Fatty acid hydroxylase domain-containing protein n=1 Tax=Stephania japonica TaxID=461633 RepID=A0AAP0F6Z8_9MAGN